MARHQMWRVELFVWRMLTDDRMIESFKVRTGPLSGSEVARYLAMGIAAMLDQPSYAFYINTVAGTVCEVFERTAPTQVSMWAEGERDRS